MSIQTPKSPSNSAVKTSSAKEAAALQRVMSPKKAASSPATAKKLAAGKNKRSILAPFPKPFELRKRCENYFLIQACILMTY